MKSIKFTEKVFGDKVKEHKKVKCWWVVEVFISIGSKVMAQNMPDVSLRSTYQGPIVVHKYRPLEPTKISRFLCSFTLSFFCTVDTFHNI